MKKFNKFITGALIMFLVTTILSSCSSSISIQKRHYTKGYHVELFKKNKKDSNKPDGKQVESAIVDQTIQTEKTLEAVAEPANVKTNDVNVKAHEITTLAQEAVVSKNLSTKRAVKSKVNTKEEKVIAENLKKVKANTTQAEETEKTDDASTHWAAIASFILGILAIISPLILGLLAIIFGLIALSAINDGNGKYKGKGYAITGLVLGAFWILIIFLLIGILLSL